MRKFLLAAILTAVAMPAFAKDSGDAAFELLSQYSAEKKLPNYIKLQSSIDPAAAMEIDEKFSEIYGMPDINRSGLKVWELENKSGKGGKLTTLMCGPDGKGGIFISADRRGKALIKKPKGSEKKKSKQSRPKKQSLSERQMKTQERD